jgi:folate-binding protein YgfZ
MWFELTSPIIAEVQGRDARRYLNNRLTADIRQLEPGHALEAAALNPQGRVEGVFLVFCDSAESFLLAAPGGNRDEVLSALSRYKVADRVTIADLSSRYRYFHVAPSSGEELSPQAFSGRVARVRRLPLSGIDVLVPRENEDPFVPPAQWAEELTDARFALLRFKAGAPIFPTEVSSDGILSEYGMNALVSFTKGCYVGQEVIERSDAIGRLPRTLERIVFDGTHVLPHDAPVSAFDSSIGRIVSSVVDIENGWSGAFALLRTGKYDIGGAVTCSGLTGVVVEQSRVME